jgi:hypothetical protein
MSRSYFNNRQPGPVMSKSSWIMVLSSTEVTSEMLNSLIPHASVEMLERMGENSATPVDVLEVLASSPDSRVRAAVSENPSCSSSLLEILATDESPDVRHRLAECPYAPMEILENLMEDDNCYVAARARRTVDRARRAFHRASVTQFGSSSTAKQA